MACVNSAWCVHAHNQYALYASFLRTIPLRSLPYYSPHITGPDNLLGVNGGWMGMEYGNG